MGIKFMIYKTKTFIQDILWFFRNTFSMRKALWEARPWDYGGLLLYNKHQLQNMTNCIDKYGIHLNKDKNVKQMKVCINLIDRIIKEDYDKWDMVDVEWIEKNSGEWGTSYLFKYDFRAKYPFPTVQGEYRRKQEMDQKKVDLEMLTEYYRKHLFKWWD